jgi:hypothetical protein
VLQQEYRHVLERMPEPKDDDVRFRLVYDGELPSEQRAPATVKHTIRKQLHPQLRNLWLQHPLLKRMTEIKSPSLGYRTVDKIADEFDRCGFKFVPLVREKNYMACRLDLLVLMRQEPYQVFTGDERGDLDNRIKTLLDGLRLPRQCNELGGQTPASDEAPFFCLLEDDKLVYEFNVKADRLLTPSRSGQADRDVFAIIDVSVTNDLGLELPTGRGGFGLR